ncbi:hypothetical protein [Oryzihumus sp.]
MGSSAPACVGLGADGPAALAGLVSWVLPRARLMRSNGSRAVLSWQDSSGARLLLGLAYGRVADLLPSLAGSLTVRLDGVTHAGGPSVASVASVASPAGRWRRAPFATTLAADVEEHWFLPSGARGRVRGPASLVALGVDVRVVPEGQDAADPLLGPGSLLPYGLLADSGPAPLTRLSGSVLRAETRTVEVTGQAFTVARVLTCGLEVDVCLAVREHPELPPPGSTVLGDVVLVGSLAGRPSRRWLPHRSRRS